MTGGSLLDGLLSSSKSLGQSLEGAAKAARADVTILILGEAGTGRSTVARALHEASDRREGPYVEVDAGTVPAELFEGELFGYRPGAFTGASGGSPGRIGRALGGTLVLDHVEELPLAIQPKLLRLIAEKTFTPLGGEEREADLRFIAIGSEDLRERVRRGAFRSDLFYRLEVVSFLLPPLRQRREDLEAVTGRILDDLSRRFGRPDLELTATAREWISSHPWPGNLRQLRNVLERELILQEGSRLDPEPPGRGGPPKSLRELERQHILDTLAYTRGHQGRAAELLGISRKSLWEKRRRYDIP